MSETLIIIGLVIFVIFLLVMSYIDERKTKSLEKRIREDNLWGNMFDSTPLIVNTDNISKIMKRAAEQMQESMKNGYIGYYDGYKTYRPNQPLFKRKKHWLQNLWFVVILRILIVMALIILIA